MSNSDADGVSFEISTSYQNLRLLELPPSLLELIRSDNPPNLKLKSTAVTNDGSQQPAAYAVLCTDDCTFQVRQVQTSNSVFIMQPTEKQLRSKDNTVPTASLCAIAQCPSLLELIPTTPPSIAFLRQKLPVYNGEQSDDFPPKPTEKLNPWDKVSKCGILEDAALSTGEFDHAWQEICAFEYGSASWIPTPSVLIKVWEAIFVAASVRSLKLDESFSVSAIASMVEELFQPGALVVAVLSRVSAGESVSSDGYARLDRERCVSWIGAVLLESLPGAMLVTDFVKQWQDQLPEVWREHASLEAIKGKYSQPSSATITFGFVGDLESSTRPKAATAKTKPNWHEKFKNAKR